MLPCQVLGGSNMYWDYTLCECTGGNDIVMYPNLWVLVRWDPDEKNNFPAMAAYSG